MVPTRFLCPFATKLPPWRQAGRMSTSRTGLEMMRIAWQWDPRHWGLWSLTTSTKFGVAAMPELFGRRILLNFHFAHASSWCAPELSGGVQRKPAEDPVWQAQIVCSRQLLDSQELLGSCREGLVDTWLCLLCSRKNSGIKVLLWVVGFRKPDYSHAKLRSEDDDGLAPAGWRLLLMTMSNHEF